MIFTDQMSSFRYRSKISKFYPHCTAVCDYEPHIITCLLRLQRPLQQRVLNGYLVGLCTRCWRYSILAQRPEPLHPSTTVWSTWDTLVGSDPFGGPRFNKGDPLAGLAGRALYSKADKSVNQRAKSYLTANERS